VQLGFVIDHSRCIGCHACTVACKSENEVPVGSFRTWVKYTESGSFPEVRRSFAVLRCNQCTNPPCVDICPVSALAKGANGVIDVDPAACIGCKSCMQGCPYDALYINSDTGTAEKCHFCAHRTEVGLAPACAVVCPTEAIVPGDFHDPLSRVSQLKAEGDLTARKTEAGTNPNVFYRDVAPAGIDPSLTNTSHGSIWANSIPGIQLDAQTFEALDKKAKGEAEGARTVYDVGHVPLWGWKVSAYLFTKSLAAGAFLASAILFPTLGESGGLTNTGAAVAAGLGLFFLFITSWLLIADLKRPGRFHFILLRPNWTSWLTRGAVILQAYAGLLFLWMLVAVFDWLPDPTVRTLLVIATAVTAVLTAVYTAWLFRQTKARVLWMWKPLLGHFFVQSVAGGIALLLLAAPIMDLSGASQDTLSLWLIGFLVAHLGFILVKEHVLPPEGREAEFRRAVRLISHGPFARRHRIVGQALGIFLPILLLLITGPGAVYALAGLLALVGLWSEEDILVRAGQALPIS
jgi:Fe-S-cluster-containing dehydrogenase component/formate-dependent nitrite reductase membrane component NrfD